MSFFIAQFLQIFEILERKAVSRRIRRPSAESFGDDDSLLTQANDRTANRYEDSDDEAPVDDDDDDEEEEDEDVEDEEADGDAAEGSYAGFIRFSLITTFAPSGSMFKLSKTH